MIVSRKLDQSSPPLDIGEWYCASSTSDPKLVIKATDVAKATAGTVLGIARQKINPGDTFEVLPKIIEYVMDHNFKAQEDGIVSWTITLLGSVPTAVEHPYVIINDLAKAERRSSTTQLESNDHIVGKSDQIGNIHLFPRRHLSEDSNDSLELGDWYCASASNSSVVVKATDAAKATVGTVLGIVLEKASPGKEFRGQENDTVPSQISGLLASLPTPDSPKRELVIINDLAKAERRPFGPADFIAGEFYNISENRTENGEDQINAGDLRILPRTLSSIRPTLNVTAPPFNAIAYSHFPLPDNAQDAGPAIQAAIESLGDLSHPSLGFSGGIVEIPFGIYRIATPITITRGGVTLRGHGGNSVDPGTLLVADEGVTPIEVAFSLRLDALPDSIDPSDPNQDPNIGLSHNFLNDGGSDAKIENICIRAYGKDRVKDTPFKLSIKNTNDQDIYQYTGTTVINGKNYNNSHIIPITAVEITNSEFKVGQVIRVAGCGNPITLSRIIAERVYENDPTNPLQDVISSNRLRIRHDNGGAFPIPEGTYLIIPGFNTKINGVDQPNRVFKRITHPQPDQEDIYEMAINAANNSVEPFNVVKYVIDHYAKIIEVIDSPPLLIVDSENFRGISAKEIDIYHGDCGILVHNKCVIENVSIGSGDFHYDFLGYGICADCNMTSNTPPSNCIGMRVSNYASSGNQGAIRYTGKDTSACVIDQILVSGQSNFGIVESSFLGNFYYGVQQAGGYGIICDNVGTTNASTFSGSYFEDGTIGSLGGGSVSIGGHMPLDMGGLSYHSASSISTFNRLLVGDINSWSLAEPFDASIDFVPKWNVVNESTGESSQWEQDVIRDKNGEKIKFPIGDPNGKAIKIDGIVQTSNISGVNISGSVDEPGTILLAGVRDPLNVNLFTNTKFDGFKAYIRLFTGHLAEDIVNGVPKLITHDGTIGIIFNYTKDDSTGEETYYRFSMSPKRNLMRLVKKKHGKILPLQEIIISNPADERKYIVGKQYEITIENFNKRIKINLKNRTDGPDDLIFDYTDNSGMAPDPNHPEVVISDALFSGAIGLYCWQNPDAHFMDVYMSSFPPNPFNYAVQMDPWAPGGAGNFWQLTSSVDEPINASGKALIFDMQSPVSPNLGLDSSSYFLKNRLGSYFTWSHSGESRKYVYCISDSAKGLSGASGDLWFPRGFWLGCDGVNTLLIENQAKYITQDKIPPFADALKVKLPHRAGNVHLYGEPLPGGYVGWSCTQPTQKYVPFGEILSHDLLVRTFTIKELKDELNLFPSENPVAITLDPEECAHKIIRFKEDTDPENTVRNIAVVLKTPSQIVLDNPFLFTEVLDQGPPTNTWDKIFHNATSNVTLTIKASKIDAGIPILPNTSQYLWSDGSNVFPAAGPVNTIKLQIIVTTTCLPNRQLRIDVVGTKFTPNKNVQIQSVPRDLINVTPELVATVLVESSGKFQVSFIAPDLGTNAAILLTATDDSGITASDVYSGGCP